MNKFSKKGFGSKPTKEWETWTTGTGDKIKVCDMTESHAKNVLNLVLQRNKRIKEKLELLGLVNKDFKRFLKEDSQWME